MNEPQEKVSPGLEALISNNIENLKSFDPELYKILKEETAKIIKDIENGLFEEDDDVSNR